MKKPHPRFSEEDVVARASQLQARALRSQEDAARRADLAAGAAEVGIAPHHLDAARVELEREAQASVEATAARQAARRETGRWIRRAAGATVFGVVALAVVTQLHLGSLWEDVERTTAQLDNVIARRQALLPDVVALMGPSDPAVALRLRTAAAMPAPAGEAGFAARQQKDRAVAEAIAALPRATDERQELWARLFDELAGAQNRISVERQRRDQAAVRYNAAARSVPWRFTRQLVGLPARAPLSVE